MTTYIYLTVTPGNLDNGRPLTFGDELELDQASIDANQRLIASGALIAKPAPKAARAKTNSSPKG